MSAQVAVVDLFLSFLQLVAIFFSIRVTRVIRPDSYRDPCAIFCEQPFAFHYHISSYIYFLNSRGAPNNKPEVQQADSICDRCANTEHEH